MTVFIIYDIAIAYKTEKPYKMVTGSEAKDMTHRHLSHSLTGVLKYQVYFI